MIICAIDPSPLGGHVVVWNGSEILLAEYQPGEIIGWHDVPCADVYLIEWITSYGMRVGASVFETCRMVGRIETLLQGEYGPVELVPRIEVKKWHCGRPSAKDADIIGALKEKYGEKGTKANPGLTYPLKADLWQAFALATYWAEKHSSPTGRNA